MKSVHNDVLDAPLNYIADNGTKLVVCSSEPTNYTQANDTYKIAEKILTLGIAGPDYAIADGASGRELTVTAQSSVPVTVSADANFLAILDTNNSKLLLVTVCVQQALTSGVDVNIPAFTENFEDPS